MNGDRGGKGDGSGGGGGDGGKVGGGHAEAVDGVGDVLDVLDDAVGVDVAVGAAGHTVGSANLLAGRVGVLVAEVDAAQLILSVELGVHGRSHRDRGSKRSRDRGGDGHRGRGHAGRSGKKGRLSNRGGDSHRGRGHTDRSGKKSRLGNVGGKNGGLLGNDLANNGNGRSGDRDRGRNRGGQDDGGDRDDGGSGHLVVGGSLLPGNKSLGFGNSPQVSFSGSGDLRGDLDGGRGEGNRGGSDLGIGNNGQVGGGDAESIDGIGGVLNVLHDAIGVDVAVGATSHAVRGSDFLSG